MLNSFASSLWACSGNWILRWKFTNFRHTQFEQTSVNICTWWWCLARQISPSTPISEFFACCLHAQWISCRESVWQPSWT
jgi:hypothetical protein